MTTLASALRLHGLEQYCEAFVAEGFDTWESVLDIQESDLITLDVKLGHRRKLQRAIADCRGIASDRPLNSPRQDGFQEPSGPDGIFQQSGNDKDQQATNKEQKRRYRRHPKPDVNGPEKPPSAYVLFSNKVRDEVKSQNLSFTDIARLVGDKWQKLDPEEKSVFENRASDSKDEYNRLLVEYKKTDDYKRYMSYLADFRAKHGGQDSTPSVDPKRPKLNSDMHSSGETDEGPQDEFDAFHTRLMHNRAGSISSLSTASRGGAPSTSLQIVTSIPRMSAELRQRSSGGNKPNDLRDATTPVQSYRGREASGSMDTDNHSFAGSHRYDTPPNETSHPGQNYSQERTVDGDSTPLSRRSQGHFAGSTYPTPRGPNRSPKLSLPPINPIPMNRPSPWDGFSPEGSRQAFNTVPPMQQSPLPGRTSPPKQFSPISQLVNPNQDFGGRTLPPIHRLSSASGFGSGSPNVFAPTSPENTQTRQIPGPETMVFRPGSQQKNEPHLNVNVNAKVGDSTNQMDSRTSGDGADHRKQPAQGNQYAGSHNISDRGSSYRR